METSIEVPSKPKNRVTIYGPAISLLGIHPEKIKILIQKDNMHPKVHSSTIYNNQDMEAIQMPIKRWLMRYILIYNVRYVHTMEFYLTIKKHEILPFTAT